MNPLKSIASGIGRRLLSYGGGGSEFAPIGIGTGYDATMPRGQRRMPQGRVFSEDQELRDLARRQLTTNLRDLDRNFEIAGWAVRNHLNYCTSFSFRSRTSDSGLDRAINDYMEWKSKPMNFDPAGRHSREALVRMWEARAVMDGDVLVNRLADGRPQTVEGDRIQSLGTAPYGELGINPEDVVNGVWINQNGRAKAYMVYKRRPPLLTGLEWDRAVPARFSDLHGFYTRYDQVRGISPMASCANRARDLYEGFDYALLKAKAGQFLGIVFRRQSADTVGDVERVDEAREGHEGPAILGGDGRPRPNEPRYRLNLGRGPVALDLEPGDEEPTIIESATPSTQFQSFSEIMMRVMLLSLDIPYCFLDQRGANYSAMRTAAIIYEKSVMIRRHAIRLLLDKLTRWELGLAILDGDISLPSTMTPAELRWLWMHSGTAWYNPQAEIAGAVAEVNAGFNSGQGVCHSLGRDAYQIIDERAELEAYAKSKGVILSTALPSTSALDPNKNATITEDENQKQSDQTGEQAGVASAFFGPAL